MLPISFVPSRRYRALVIIGGLKISLKRIDRNNWLDALALELHHDQVDFVSSPVKSLAAAYIRQYGENYEHLPMGIYDGDKMVGYVSTLCDPASKDEYWLDDILIDHRFQRRGYGRPAVIETLHTMLQTYSNCRAIRLTCHRNNSVAARLYDSLGFKATGRLNPTVGQPEYELSGDALERYR